MRYLLFIFLLLSFFGVFGQNSTFGDSYSKSKLSKGPSITIEQRIKIEEQIAINTKALRKRGIIKKSNLSKDILFGLPIKSKDGYNDPGVYTISSYVDHDALFSGHLKDYNCGELTYDTEDGYNHQGTDFLLWPFPWYKMDNNEVEVVAAAAGIIVHKQDGNFDRNCNGEDLTWNAIFIEHSKGFVTWYGHLKNGSVAEKEVGEEVEMGEYLGIVGSSGISVLPHLHFEVHDEMNNLIDPYFGPCNPGIIESLWLDQKPYIDAGINRIATNSTLPVYLDCPEQEVLNESSDFYGNDTIFLLLYFRNISTNEEVEITISRPDNSIHSQWIWENPLPYYIASWNYWFLILKGEQNGTWNFKAKYNNETYIHEFQYSNTEAIEENEIQRLTILPNPVSGKAKITIPETLSKDFSFQIINIAGQKMRLIPEINEDRNTLILNCEILQTGTYFIFINNNVISYRGQLIKR